MVIMALSTPQPGRSNIKAPVQQNRTALAWMYLGARRRNIDELVFIASMRPQMYVSTSNPAKIILDDIYRQRKVLTSDGEMLPLNSEVSPQEGEFIYNLIRMDSAITRTLEIGCAYGVSSLNICAALQGRVGARHTIVDPFQTTWWKSVGVSNLRRAGLSNFDLVEENSEYVLPRLAAENENQFDFIFVDGWHTFDHTMIDCFYATRLLRVGGYLVLDDAHWQSVSKVVRYLGRYPCFKKCGNVSEDSSHLGWKTRTAKSLFSFWPFRNALPYLSSSIQAAAEDRSSMIALRKFSQDKRSFDWFVDF